MNPVTLYRTDPTANMARFYRLEIQRDLFGAWCVMREWGRIGTTGHLRSDPYPTPTEAADALERQRLAKLRRGYAGESDSATR